LEDVYEIEVDKEKLNRNWCRERPSFKCASGPV